MPNLHTSKIAHNSLRENCTKVHNYGYMFLNIHNAKLLIVQFPVRLSVINTNGVTCTEFIILVSSKNLAELYKHRKEKK